MFLRVNNEFVQMLIKVDDITKIISRPGPSKDSDISQEYEVGVFTQDERQLVTGHEGSVWVGNYEVIYRGSSKECNEYLDRISDLLPSTVCAD